MEKSGQWSVASKATPSDSRRRIHPRAGPQRDMMCVRCPVEARRLLHGRPDPTAAHLPLSLDHGYDLIRSRRLKNKKKWIPQGGRRWLVISVTNQQQPAGYLREQGGK